MIGQQVCWWLLATGWYPVEPWQTGDQLVGYYEVVLAAEHLFWEKKWIIVVKIINYTSELQQPVM